MTPMMIMVIPLAKKFIVVCVIFYISLDKYNSLPFEEKIPYWSI